MLGIIICVSVMFIVPIWGPLFLKDTHHTDPDVCLTQCFYRYLKGPFLIKFLSVLNMLKMISKCLGIGNIGTSSHFALIVLEYHVCTFGVFRFLESLFSLLPFKL